MFEYRRFYDLPGKLRWRGFVPQNILGGHEFLLVALIASGTISRNHFMVKKLMQGDLSDAADILGVTHVEGIECTFTHLLNHVFASYCGRRFLGFGQSETK
jgi:hypothetical protein